jgi:hypothetical protein
VVAEVAVGEVAFAAAVAVEKVEVSALMLQQLLVGRHQTEIIIS